MIGAKFRLHSHFLPSIQTVFFGICLINAAFFLLITYYHGDGDLTFRSVSKFEVKRPAGTGNSVTAHRADGNPLGGTSGDDKRATAHCDPAMTVVSVACGDRLEEVLNLVQSILMFTKCSIKIIVFMDENQKMANDLLQYISSAQIFRHVTVSITVREAFYPANAGNTSQWKEMYAACSTYRLFLPAVLNDTDAVIYLDSDTLLVSPIEELWSYFARMSRWQMVGLAQEHEGQSISWYGTHDYVPHPGCCGVNSGVMLMNLTKMRQVGWDATILSTFHTYRRVLKLPDQDVLNAILAVKSEWLLLLPCKWNFRAVAGHCNSAAGRCENAFKDVAKILHGNSGAFRNPQLAHFYAIYRTFREFNVALAVNLDQSFVRPLELALSKLDGDPCEPVQGSLITNLKVITANQLLKTT